jgi:hypothetical protein
MKLDRRHYIFYCCQGKYLEITNFMMNSRLWSLYVCILQHMHSRLRLDILHRHRLLRTNVLCHCPLSTNLLRHCPLSTNLLRHHRLSTNLLCVPCFEN